MAIFRGTGGSGSSSDSTIVDAVTAQATIATTKAGEASTSATTATTKASEASTSATTATTKASEASTSATTASTKATEATTAKTGAETAQTAAEAARDAALGHSNTANSSAVQTVAGSNTQVVGVYNNIANVNTVAGVNTDVTTVAGISSDVTTVAADASDIGTVSTNIANVNNVGNNIANVNAVHGNASNINTVAADGTDIGTVSSNIANVNTVAGISSNVTTVAGLESKMDTVIADASDIGAVAGNIGDVTTVAGINSDVDTVAGIAAKVTTVADNISDVQNADTNATNAASSASNASASATSASNSATTATTKATEASNSATAASNSATTATTKASQAAGSATTAGTSASTATTKASEASASATTATTKAGEAASSASAASGSATTAVTKASEASASAASASTSATNSSNAASTWNDFYTTYLGAADAPPTVDVQGNALQTGAFYYDTGAGSNTVGLYVYNGSSWVYSTNYNNVTAPYSLSQDLATNSHDISFGDNAKATFGASDDLQIYHDGSNSYIRDDGTGELRLNSDNAVRIRKHDNETLALFSVDGSATLYHNNSAKIATTSTGIDVTGTATMDGLTVDGTGYAYLGNTAAYRGELNYDSSGNTSLTIANSWNNDNSEINFKVKTAGTGKKALQIKGSGDISFYEDTGTTPKFFWDASAESLGIGTTSPATALDISQSNARGAYLRSSTTGSRMHFLDATTASITTVGIGAEGNNLVLHGGGAEFMRVASSGNVGIGVTSPTGKLQIYKGGQSSYQTYTATNSGLILQSYQSQGSPYTKTSDIVAGSDGTVPSEIRLLTRTAGQSSVDERMRITSDGNVGIGDTNPARKLTVQGGSGDNLPVRVVGGSGTTKSHMEFQDASTTADYKVTLGSVGDGMSFQAGGSERMRIDSSGNVLVGTTDANVSNNSGTANSGINLLATGQIFAAYGGNTANFNRLGSDGGIINFDKDGTTVGSIGTYSGLLTVGHGDVGLVFSEGGDSILPFNQTSNALRDAAINLGDSTRRFKDLYLSGGVHLGGTGTANKLDDYEEGTFTPSLTFAGQNTGMVLGSVHGTYTKVGRMVTSNIRGTISTLGSSTGQLYLEGLPFTVGDTLPSTGLEAVGHVGFVSKVQITTTNLNLIPSQGGTFARFPYTSSSYETEYLGSSNISNGFDFRATLTYFTA
jgi:membrane protein involved in colicin uptake